MLLKFIVLPAFDLVAGYRFVLVNVWLLFDGL
jgi:hypothetical protein